MLTTHQTLIIYFEKPRKKFEAFRRSYTIANYPRKNPMRCMIFALLMMCSPASADVGFFSPQGIFDGFSKKVDFAMFNAATPEQVSENLAKAAEAGLRVNIDLGPVMADSADPAKLTTTTLQLRAKENPSFSLHLYQLKFDQFLQMRHLNRGLLPILTQWFSILPHSTPYFLWTNPI